MIDNPATPFTPAKSAQAALQRLDESGCTVPSYVLAALVHAASEDPGWLITHEPKSGKSAGLPAYTFLGRRRDDIPAEHPHAG